MKIMQRFIIVLLILILGGCSPLSVNWDYDPSIDFSGLKTYDWMVDSEKPTNDPRLDEDTLLHSRIRTAVDKELAAKGFHRRTSGEPDFLIGYYLTLDKKVSPTTALSLYTYSTWGKYLEGGYYEFEAGTLILDIVKPGTRKLMWRGSSTDEVNFSESPETKVARIDKVVNRMLQKFPPN